VTAGANPEEFSRVSDAVTKVIRRLARRRDALDRAAGYGELLAALHEQVVTVTAERDAALVELLRAPAHPSHRSLATDLGLSRQRVDQLATIAARGGRARRPTR
jgi:hypothetical protein